MNLQIVSFDTIFYMFFQSEKSWWNARIWAFFAGRIIFITFFVCLFFWLSCTSTHIFGLNLIYSKKCCTTLDENLFYQEWDLTCIRVLRILPCGWKKIRDFLVCKQISHQLVRVWSSYLHHLNTYIEMCDIVISPLLLILHSPELRRTYLLQISLSSKHALIQILK